MTLYPAVVYKRCDKLCNKCRQCVAFQKLLDKIDLEQRSLLDRRREAEKEEMRKKGMDSERGVPREKQRE